MLCAGVLADPPDHAAAKLSSTSDAYWERLNEIRAGTRYAADVPTGVLRRVHTLDDNTKFHYVVDVPETYHPDEALDLHIYLHGGVSSSSNRISIRKIRRLEKLKIKPGIAVYPSAWGSAKWWYEPQTRNIEKIIADLKATYRIDDNRVFLHGLSDGASGAYYFASHLPTTFAGFLAYLGSPHVLRPKHKVFGETYPGNLLNKPILAVNARDDHLFPADSVEALFEAINGNGGDIRFHSVAGDHFGMPWLGKLKPEIEQFVTATTREPYPDTLFWQTDSTSVFNRIHWLVASGTDEGDSVVVATKRDNAVYLSSRNVAAVTLLISSDHFDLDKPIQVWLNRGLVFDQQVSPDVLVLDKWYARDRDRSMLFASEIRLPVSGQ
jgi:enterochelin esterase-like enzyme